MSVTVHNQNPQAPLDPRLLTSIRLNANDAGGIVFVSGFGGAPRRCELVLLDEVERLTREVVSQRRALVDGRRANDELRAMNGRQAATIVTLNGMGPGVIDPGPFERIKAAEERATKAEGTAAVLRLDLTQKVKLLCDEQRVARQLGAEVDKLRLHLADIGDVVDEALGEDE